LAASCAAHGVVLVAIGKGRDKEKLRRMGRARLHRYCRGDDAAVLQQMAGARASLATGPRGGAMRDELLSAVPREASSSWWVYRGDPIPI